MSVNSGFMKSKKNLRKIYPYYGNSLNSMKKRHFLKCVQCIKTHNITPQLGIFTRERSNQTLNSSVKVESKVPNQVSKSQPLIGDKDSIS